MSEPLNNTPASLAKPASEPHAGGDVDANGVDMSAVEGTLGAAKKAGIVVSFNDVWAIVTLYRAALSSSAGPAEPVAWMRGEVGNITHLTSNKMPGHKPLYAHPAPATVESDGLSRNDICRLWQDAAINRPNLTVEGFTNLLLCEIDDRAALAPATEGRK